MTDRTLFPFADEDNAEQVTRFPTYDEALKIAVINAMNGFPEAAQVWIAIADRVDKMVAGEVAGKVIAEALIDADGDIWYRDAANGLYGAKLNDLHDAFRATREHIEKEWGPVREVRIVAMDGKSLTDR